MWNGPTPNNIEFTAFSDARFCAIVDDPPALFGNPAEFVTDFGDLMDMADYEAWRCPACGRLYVFDKQENPNRAKYIYKLETENDL